MQKISQGSSGVCRFSSLLRPSGFVRWLMAVVVCVGVYVTPLEAQAAVCGNGIKETGEICDDGNTIDADGCNATCKLMYSPVRTATNIRVYAKTTATSNCTVRYKNTEGNLVFITSGKPTAVANHNISLPGTSDVTPLRYSISCSTGTGTTVIAAVGSDTAPLTYDPVHHEPVHVSRPKSEALINGYTGDKLSINSTGRYVAFDSAATNLVTGDTNASKDVFVHDIETGQIERVSVNSKGDQTSGTATLLPHSTAPSMSADGRYVAFHSTATNLEPNDVDAIGDIFLRDRVEKKTSMVSVYGDGNSKVQANGHSLAQVELSRDGRFVVFASNATNLANGVATGDTNAKTDIFIRNISTSTAHGISSGATKRISITSSTVIPARAQANNASTKPSISADGRYVVFESVATNLATGSALGDVNGVSDVFTHDVLTGETKRIAPIVIDSKTTTTPTTTTITTYAYKGSFNPIISGDGRYVSFTVKGTYTATTTPIGGTAGTPLITTRDEIFRYDRESTATDNKPERVSVDRSDPSIGGNQSSSLSQISHDGRYVIFNSFATNLVPSGPTASAMRLYIWDSTQRNITSKINGIKLIYQAGSTAAGAAMTPDGHYVVFRSILAPSTTTINLWNRQLVPWTPAYAKGELFRYKNPAWNLPATPVCGDSILSPSEGCDDGNLSVEECRYGIKLCEVCDATCQFVRGETDFCRDGTIDAEAGEQCDDGNETDTDDCTNACKDAFCGDKIIRGSVEICDDGTSNGTPNKCNSVCMGVTTPVCGNMVVEAGEGCDDGNALTEECAYGQASCTVCDADCQTVPGAVAYCGDGAVNGSEQCDGGECCEAGCTFKTAGIECRGVSGVCDTAESCTGRDASCPADSFLPSGTSCRPSAAGGCDVAESCDGTASCPDDVKVPNGSACNDGIDGTSADKCTEGECHGDVIVCGDGFKDDNEQCDDSNTTDGDGCSANCVAEKCGDGVVNNNGAEQCDDGNQNRYDGCTDVCKEADLISIGMYGGVASNDRSMGVRLSADNEHAFFMSFATNLTGDNMETLPNDGLGGRYFTKDLKQGMVSDLMFRGLRGLGPYMSGNSQYASYAINKTLYLRDFRPNINVNNDEKISENSSEQVEMSHSGHHFAFVKINLVAPGSRERLWYLRDRVAGTTDFITIYPDGTPKISADGNTVVFATTPHLASYDPVTKTYADNSEKPTKIYIYDVKAKGRPRQLVPDFDSDQWVYSEPSTSLDGRYITFMAANYSAGKPWGVFVHDSVANTTEPVADNSDAGVGDEQYDVSQGNISTDGRHVFFITGKTYTANGVRLRDATLHVYDRVTKTKKRAYTTTNSYNYNPGIVSYTISPDGQYVGVVVNRLAQTLFKLEPATNGLFEIIRLKNPLWTPGLCGNGTVDPSEECDDGNRADHDGCSAICTIEINRSNFADICDGQDNNLNGSIDEGFVSTPTSCGIGACATTGSTSCSVGVVVDSCVAKTPETSTDACDGVDNDCDSSIDEDFAATPTSCGIGACAATGSTSCSGVGGVVDSCAPGQSSATDTCNDNVDNDCDGTADEGCCGNGVAEAPEACDDGNMVSGDGCPDNCMDQCPDDMAKVEPGVCGCGTPDEDVDGDGKLGCRDNCVGVANPDQLDTDSDGFGDVCDDCPTTPNPNQMSDRVNGGWNDGDNVGALCDNCRGTANNDQLDTDGDCPVIPPNGYTNNPLCGDECDPPVCGNGFVEKGGVIFADKAEQCDDGNTTREECAYSETSCMVCDADCQTVPGAVAYCGDGAVNGSEQCDGGTCCTATCTFIEANTVCRASEDVCDTAETCSGNSATCPTDIFATAGTECRASAGGCDVAETCTGSGASCPADSFLPSGTSCRPSAGGCDVAESCDGSNAACPTDGFVAGGTVCRAASGDCDVTEVCEGTGASCPADSLLPSGTSCRASAGVCDVAESCDGTASCPGDVKVPNGTDCNDGIDGTRADKCTEGGECHGDVIVCGDGFKDENEQCDDGNTSDADLCLNTCQKATLAVSKIAGVHANSDLFLSFNTTGFLWCEALDSVVSVGGETTEATSVQSHKLALTGKGDGSPFDYTIRCGMQKDSPEFIESGPLTFDPLTQDIALVSIGPDGVAKQGNAGASTMAADNRYVFFTSGAIGGIAGPVLKKDMKTGVVENVPVSNIVIDAELGQGPDISPDGRYIVYAKSETVAGISTGQVYVKDLMSNSEPEVISKDVSGSGLGDGYSGQVTTTGIPLQARQILMDAQGRRVVFGSTAENLVADDPHGGNDKWDLFVRDRVTNITDVITVTQAPTSIIEAVGISADGRTVAYVTPSKMDVSATSSQDTNGGRDIYVYDTETRENTLLPVGVEYGQGRVDAYSSPLGVSMNGNLIAYVAGVGTGSCKDIFVYDRSTGSAERLATTANGVCGDFYDIKMSVDGRYVFFRSHSGDLPGAVHDAAQNVYYTSLYAHDRENKTTRLVYAGTSNWWGDFPNYSISPDGRYASVTVNRKQQNLIPWLAGIFSSTRLYEIIRVKNPLWTTILCGNGVRDSDEECDDGNLDMGDGCSFYCDVEVCGDGFTNNRGTEQCDDANTVIEDCAYGVTSCTVCDASCQEVAGVVHVCGDGVKDAPEGCDDGGTSGGDGCSQNCGVESGWSCGTDANGRSACDICGNGIKASYEQCDDGNTSGGDGCDHWCYMEWGYTCRSSPSVCQKCGNGKTEGTEFCDGPCCNSTCTAYKSAGTTCRTAIAGGCDVKEVCSGSSATCPVDTYEPAGKQCRSSAGDCDVAESCTGTSNRCPTNKFATSDIVCRSSTGVCDAAENCSGSSASCPSDTKASDDTFCDDGNGGTFADHCVSGVCVGNPVCGDGNRVDPEQCDDGNRTVSDDCSNDCRNLSVSVCGDGNTHDVCSGYVEYEDTPVDQSDPFTATNGDRYEGFVYELGEPSLGTNPVAVTVSMAGLYMKLVPNLDQNVTVHFCIEEAENPPLFAEPDINGPDCVSRVISAGSTVDHFEDITGLVQKLVSSVANITYGSDFIIYRYWSGASPFGEETGVRVEYMDTTKATSCTAEKEAEQEECDDGNTASDDGCDSLCRDELNPTMQSFIDACNGVVETQSGSVAACNTAFDAAGISHQNTYCVDPGDAEAGFSAICVKSCAGSSDCIDLGTVMGEPTICSNMGGLSICIPDGP